MSSYDEINDVLDELREYCLSGELTLPTLRDKMKKLDQFTSHDVQEMYALRPFFDYICLSKRVSMEIVEYVLDSVPFVARTMSENDSTEYEDFGITYGTHIHCIWHAIIPIAHNQSSDE